MARGPFRSVRARIVAAAALAVAAVLGVSGVALVSLIHRSLERPMRGEARARAADVVALVNVVPAPSIVPALAAPWPTLVQVIDEAGRVIAASRELTGRPALLSVTAQHREPVGSTRFVSNGRNQNWRLDGVAANISGRSASIIVATSLAQIERSARLVAVALAIGIPLLVALVALSAWFLVGRALHPVEALRREVEHFDQHRGSRRLGIPPSDDEVGRLARTFNALLDRLEWSGAQQRRFVADASHELRSPVANIRAAVEVALAHPGRAQWPDVASDVLVQNDRMGALVDDLLTLARAEGGTDRSRAHAQVELGAVVRKVRDSAISRRVPVRFTSIADVSAAGDAGQLERVVENLVANAVRHASTSVTVTVTKVGRLAQLTVSDDGAGIPEADRARVFEPFVRVDADRSRQTGGTGLGLAIVAEIVGAHHGTVTIADAHPGAVITVRIPANPAGLSASS